MSVAPARPGDTITLNADGTLSGRARGVPFARDAQHLAVLAGVVGRAGRDAGVPRERRHEPGERASNTVTFDRVTPLAVAPAQGFDQTALMLMGCVVRSVQTAGALEAILDMTVRYANERVAFERPIAKFQAVQHNLARLAGEVAGRDDGRAFGRRRDRARATRSTTRSSSRRPRRKSARPKPRRKAPRSRIRCTARSASPASTSCIATRCGCSPGATTSATRATGRRRSATGSRRAAPTNSGRWSRRANRMNA